MKRIMSFSLLLTMIIIPLKANASTINNNGIEITDEQYERILGLGFTNNEIMNMEQDFFDELMKGQVYSTTEIVKYYKDGYSFRGLETPVVEITKEEYDAINKNSSNISTCTDKVFETNAKKLTLVVNNYSVDGKQKLVLAKLEWKYVPKVKSTDVFAIMTDGQLKTTPSATQVMKELGFFPISNCQRQYIENETTYSSSHPNWTVTPTGTTLHYTGIGIAMPLNTKVQSCTNRVGLHLGVIQGYEFRINTFVTATSGNTVTLRTSYQHATSSVSVSDAKNYKFSSSGLGGVIKFNSSSISSKYDAMGGIVFTG